MATHIVIGAGIIGACIAERLARAGEDVLLIDGASGPACGATAASFGWINASFYQDAAHFRLRDAGLSTWRDLGRRIKLPPPDARGALSWDGDLDTQERELTALGYAVERLPGGRRIAALEPALLDPPQDALLFTEESAIDAGQATRAILAAAHDAGARAVYGQKVLSILVDDARAVGVETDAGLFLADHVTIAAGTATKRLLKPLGIDIPLKQSPADTLITRPAPPLLSHVLVTPEREIKQTRDGRFQIPSSPNHQAMGGLEAFNLKDVSEASLAVLRRHLPVGALGWERVVRAERPMPADGLPIVGPTEATGLYVAVLHSGITLAPLIGEIAAAEITAAQSKRATDLLEPYRLSRFGR
ncbi:MAG: FAD-binding oxidoreductase [Pseudomonadota bacterium]